MAEINDLSDTDASNVARFPEGQAPSTVNNGARALEGLVSRWHNTINGSVATTGAADTYVWACPQTLSAYYDGLIICVDINATCTGASTINVDALGAKAIKKHNDQALEAGDLESGGKYILVYDGTNFQLLSSGANVPSTFENVVEDTTPQLGGDLDLNGNNIDFPTTADVSDCLDEDNMASDSATVLATQQSIKAYADSLVVSQANQAAIEAQTNENTYIPPDLLKHCPLVPKAVIVLDGTDATPITPSFNAGFSATVTKGSTGIFTFTMSTAMTAGYGVVATAGGATAELNVSEDTDLRTTTVFVLEVRTVVNVVTDPVSLTVAVYGDLP